MHYQSSQYFNIKITFITVSLTDHNAKPLLCLVAADIFLLIQKQETPTFDVIQDLFV